MNNNKCFYDGDLCNYLCIDPSEPYYKSFIFGKIITKPTTNIRFNDIQLDEKLINIIKSKTNVYLYNYLRKYKLKQIISKLIIISTKDLNQYKTVKLFEKGNNILSIII